MALTAWASEPCRCCGAPIASDYGETLCERCYDTAPRCRWCGEPVTRDERRMWGGFHRDCRARMRAHGRMVAAR